MRVESFLPLPNCGNGEFPPKPEQIKGIAISKGVWRLSYTLLVYSYEIQIGSFGGESEACISESAVTATTFLIHYMDSSIA